MKIAGIIAEYNPFHSGHAYQLSQIRQTLGADYMIAVMSGDFVQRGEPAIFPKHLRAKAALECGVDLVLELPPVFASASAEQFARGGVSLLNQLGVVDWLCFGCENAREKSLQALALLLAKEPAHFQEQLRSQLRMGVSFPKARELAAIAYWQENASSQYSDSISAEEIRSLLSKPNNILGIEYMKAIIRSQSAIRPVPLPRRGSGYLEDNLKGKAEREIFQEEDSASASALALRKVLFQGTSPHAVLTQWEPYLPHKAFMVFQEAILQNAWLSQQSLDLLLRYRLLYETPESLAGYQDMTPALADRILAMRNSCLGFESFAEKIKTKDITLSRVKRCLLHILLGFPNKEFQIGYARVLGLRRESSRLLRQIQLHSSIPLVVKPSSSSECRNDRETVFASNLYQTLLSDQTGQACRHDLAMSPVVV